MIHYTFEDVNQGTIVFMDEGSNTSLITTKLSNSLFLQGKVKLTNVTKACEKDGKTRAMIHHNIEFVDWNRTKHMIHCIQVDHITKVQEQPDLDMCYNLFPHLPKGSLNYPDMEVGLLLGQNANALLPTGGTGKNMVGNLRVRRTLLGKHGYVLEGWHSEIWKVKLLRTKVQSFRAKVNKLTASPKQFFPDLADMPMEVPRTCPNCKNCSQCQYELQDMTFKEKKELDALRAAVTLNSNHNVY